MPTAIATHVQNLSPAVRLPSFPLPWKSREQTDRGPHPAALMPEFARQFDELVDLLCWSAKDGDHEGRDEQYATLRSWFLKNYEPIRPHLLSHLTAEPEDTMPARPGHPAPRDAFESLFLPRDVDAIIHSETVIDRIIRTRHAVDALRDELCRRYDI